MAAQVTEQAELAVAAADAVVFVVDATVGTQDIDEAVVKVLRRSGKPVILAANKVDDQRTEAEAAAMWQLGLGEPFPVSALHGRGAVTCWMRFWRRFRRRHERCTNWSAVRVVLPLWESPMSGSQACSTRSPERLAGTTVDPVDELVELGGEIYRFIDTAGIRRRVKEISGHEYYASLRTQGAIERAEVCVVVAMPASRSPNRTSASSHLWRRQGVRW